ncbi:uncharacterized protein BJX67DRAFT_157055 [Aspergillus lucknowensis]|uniref:WD40 repeat-like protein n=1 Tax=Aspergillus lucknowensis TaxID=176173 RepID=A0ABR4LP08_9EURO
MALQYPASKTTVYLDQPPSCLQFCPASPNNFVLGTYLLSETKTQPKTLDIDDPDQEPSETIQQSKTGSLQLWNLDPASNALTQLSRTALPHAVFDLHFHPRNPTLLGIATSAASVSLFSVSDETGLTHLLTYPVHEDPSIPALFLAWTPENWLPGSRDGFAVTFSDGRTGVFGLNSAATRGGRDGDGDGDGAITELGSFDAKPPVEVWFVALASFPHSQHGSPEPKKQIYTPYLFTGNDFGSLHTRRFADITIPEDETPDHDHDHDRDDVVPLPSPVLSADDKARHHTAGVTAILPLPIPLIQEQQHPAMNAGDPLLLTGSYDEVLRVYHAVRGGRVIGERGLGGGVWRLQLLHTIPPPTATTAEGEGEAGKWTFLVLATCMHGGTRVVRVVVTAAAGAGGEPRAEIEVLAEFTEHESMNYASDVWRPGSASGVDEGVGKEGSELRVVSSSFYDKRLCVWTLKV